MKCVKPFFAVLLSCCLVVTTALFPARAVSEPISVVYGDLDKNGTINAADALVVLQMAVSEELIEDLELIAAADVTGDVMIDGDYWYDAADALEILKYAVGKIKVFPAEKLDPYAKPHFEPDGVLTEGQEVDFVLEFPADHKVKILTLCDIHLALQPSEWIWPYVEESIAQTDPDIIVLNGDNISAYLDYEFIGLPEYYGKYWQEMCDKMDSYQIPWLLGFGNHDRQGAHDLDWQLDAVRNSRYGMVSTADCTGNGNYVVAIKQGDEYTQLIYMVDTNGSGDITDLNPDKDRIEPGNGVFPDQLRWLQRTNYRITYDLGEQIPSVMFMHEAPEFVNQIAGSKYPQELTWDTPLSEIFTPYQEGDYGWITRGSKLPLGQSSPGLYQVVREIGCREMVFGHTHGSPVSIVEESSGLRITWGVKSGWTLVIDQMQYFTLEENVWLVGATVLSINPQTKECVSHHVLNTLPPPQR